MTMREVRCLDVNEALLGRGKLVKAALMAALGGVLVLAGVGCSSSSTSGNQGGAAQGGTAAGGSRAGSSPATTASGGQTAASTTGQTGTGGSLASGGNTASGGITSVPTGGVGPSGGSSSTSTATGGGSGGGTSAGGTQATGGTTVSGGTTGGVGGRGGTTTIVGGTSGGNGGSVSGGSVAGGSAAAGSPGTGGRDAGLDVAMLPDSSSSADAAADRGAQADADAGGEGDSDVTSLCKGILVDNNAPPEIYPVIYREPANALDQFGAEKARLLSTYGLSESAYTITATAITRVAQMQGGGSTWLRLNGGQIDQSNAVPITEAFLSDWGKLFGYGGILTTPHAPFAPYCFSNFCRVDFTQDYCGLSLYSHESDYSGTATVLLQSQVGGVYRIVDGFVPMLPVPRNVLVTQQQVISAIVGKTFTYECATGPSTVQVSDQDVFTVPSTQVVHIGTSPTIAAALEYRLAIPVHVTARGTSWTVYVDGIDGSFIEAVANFICS